MDVRLRTLRYRAWRAPVPRRAALGAAGGGVVALGLGRRPAPISAQATPAALPPIVERWAAAWNAHGPATMAALFSDDGVYEDLAFAWYIGGKERVAEWVAITVGRVPDVRFELVGASRSGDRAAAEWLFAGTHTGYFTPDFPPTGRTFPVRVASVFKLEGELIQRVAGYDNLSTWHRQLGLPFGPSSPEGRPVGTPPA